MNKPKTPQSENTSSVSAKDQDSEETRDLDFELEQILRCRRNHPAGKGLKYPNQPAQGGSRA